MRQDARPLRRGRQWPGWLTVVLWLAAWLSASAACAQAPGVSALVQAARAQVGVTVRYDGTYVRLAYPGGDVPIDRGVCTDVLVRALRAQGQDLQKLVHEDMRAHFAAYPALWGLRRPDRNIDHRRVPNLKRYFQRRGLAVPATSRAADYLAGDIVSWRLPGGLPHIGIVSDRRSADGARPLVIHNIGAGVREEDVLFAWAPVGHYRWPASLPASR